MKQHTERNVGVETVPQGYPVFVRALDGLQTPGIDSKQRSKCMLQQRQDPFYIGKSALEGGRAVCTR